jgi:sialate O-acetylesterase
MKKKLYFRSFTALTVLAVVGTVNPQAQADVKLPSFFSDGMVLQREARVPVWGTADVGEAVTVSVAGQTVRSTADAAGKWMVDLTPLPVGAPLEVVIEGKNKLTVHDVLVGEVWLASGQSNMEWSVRRSANADAEIAVANYPAIRMFTAKRSASPEPSTDVPGQWKAATPEVVGAFSAVGYFFARELHQKLGVPVGIIHTSWGGTPIESWTKESVLRADEKYKAVFERWQRAVEDYPAAKKEHDAKVAQWEAAAAAAKAEGKLEPTRPAAIADPNTSRRPGALYNGMIAPFVPYAVRGFLWYQGEANAGRAYQYRDLFQTMIRDWRADWNQELPFLFVQLANYRARKEQPDESDWAELREAQTMALALPRTGMAVTIDVGEEKSIHPLNKQDVGHRLAVAALAQEYDQNIPYSGPMYDSMAVEGNAIRLKFKHTNDGLVAKDGALQGFAIAGEDRKFVWADARIDGDTVVVSSPAVTTPVAVRYAWANNPAANLYNGAGLPTSPFRTDDWPVSTQNKS